MKKTVSNHLIGKSPTHPSVQKVSAEDLARAGVFFDRDESVMAGDRSLIPQNVTASNAPHIGAAHLKAIEDASA